jgi:vacuolar-type H+-ATPase subunit D/Vma8
VNYVVMAIVVGYLVVAVVRLILDRKLVKKTRDYEQMVEEKMAELQHDLQTRSDDLKESIQMINQEYSKLMGSMSQQRQSDTTLMMEKMAELKAQQAAAAATSPLDKASNDAHDASTE